MSYNQLAQHWPSSTYDLLRALSVTPCSLFSRMCLRTIDSTRDVSDDQWVASVPFYYLFDVSFGFL